MSNSKAPSTDRLAKYRAKRSAGATPEPFGAAGGDRPRLFVVQKHAARRLHYDFRIEWGGSLWSWAVPRGPSMNPSENRLAVHVEDHPVEYADFEGVIPEGNYGAGSVIVWDKGLWVPLDEDPEQGLAEGKLHFELRGYKLRGVWLLLRPKDDNDEWFLKKKKDAHSTEGGDEPFTEESILSGLTVEELRDGRSRAARLALALDEAGVPRRKLEPLKLSLMLAKTAEAPFDSPAWLFELKYDGYRLIAARDAQGDALLRSRNGHDLTGIFPEIARAVASLPYEGLVMDGELVVLDEGGRPSFQRLQGRSQLRRRSEIDRASIEGPATLMVFDLLGFEGRDVRPLPLARRKETLRALLPKAGPLRYSDHIAERGVAMYEQVERMGLEGIVAKESAAPYRGGRSARWLKIVVAKTADFVVCGFTEPQGRRPGFGALHLGIYDGGELVYAGRVGTGFSDAQLEKYRAALDSMLIESPAVSGALPAGSGHRWVRPEWVVEVKYKQWTDDGVLRAPVFVRLREDKHPEECVRDSHAPIDGPAATPVVEDDRAERAVAFTNLDKVFWPREGYTKGDLIEYYRSVSPWLLPYLEDRPLVLTRYPDGISGKFFYQKNVPDHTPDWVRTIAIWSEHTEREIEYFVCGDAETLLYVINSGAIPLHVWSSRTATIQHPDWCILDLDPKGAPFEHVIVLAQSVRELCESIGLPSFVKTTGSTGLHILLPLGGQCTYEQSRQLGQLLAQVVESEHPEIATMNRVVSTRGGRVYLDYLQNRHGQLLVSPYSVRPLAGAPVSAPLDWDEVETGLEPQRYTIANLLARLERQTVDPMLAILSSRPDLMTALSRLAERLESY